jgi:hypothetical protein
MADGDFLDLQNQLGAMMGADDVSNLPLVEQERIKKIINQCYRETYTPSDGRRPKWTQRAIGFDLAGVINIEADISKGSTSFTFVGSELLPENEGSMCFVGGEANRVIDVDTSSNTGELLVPAAADATTLTVYTNSYRLPQEVVDVDGRPERVGWGVLSPMHGHDEEARYRSLLGYDFAPETAFGHRRAPHINSNGDEYTFGDPMFFYIDSASFGSEVSLSRRLVIYPLPKEKLSIKMRVNVLPAKLVEDADRPLLPADAVDDILLPIARARIAMVDPRYNSQNIKFLIADAEDAKRRLSNMSDPQKVKSRRMRVKTGY